MSKLFNRKDAAVIEFGLNHTEEEFVENYSETSASAETLKKAFKEINGNKTKSKIAVQSGDGDPNEPLKPVHYAADENGNIKKIDTTNIPKRSIESVSSPEKAKAKGRKPGIIADVEAGKKPAKPKAVKATAAKGEKKPFTRTAATKTGKELGNKRDAIKALLAKDGTMSNKDIKAAILQQGYASIYDSEISSCRVK